MGKKGSGKIMSRLSFSSIAFSLAVLVVCSFQTSSSKAKNLSEVDKPSLPPLATEEYKQNIPYARFYLGDTPLWKADFKAPIAWLAVNNRLLNVGSLFARRIASYDMVSGISLWDKSITAPVSSPPLYLDNTLVAVAKDCSINCLDTISGETKHWILPFPYDRLIQESKKRSNESLSNYSERLTAAQAIAKAKEKVEERHFHNQLLRLKFKTLPRLSYSAPCRGENDIVCLSGDGIITQFTADGTSINWSLLDCYRIGDKPFISAPAIQVFTKKKSEYLYAVSSNGQLWSIDLNDPTSSISQTIDSGKGNFRQPLRIIRNFLYATASEGPIFCYALGADSESSQYFKPKLIWRYGQTKGRGEQTNSQGLLINEPSFDLHKPRCFFINDNDIISLSSLSGQLLWRYQSPLRFSTPALYWNGNVLAATEKQTLLVIDSESGQLKKEYPLPFVPSCPLTIDDKYLYLGGSQGEIACFEIGSTPFE